VRLARFAGGLSAAFQNNQGLVKPINQIMGFPIIDDNRTSTNGILPMKQKTEVLPCRTSDCRLTSLK
jgi:hypothetical protein